MKLCKDCKHYKFGIFHPFPLCKNQEAVRHPVSGIAFADFERSSIGRCGKNGDLFRRKRPWLTRLFGR